MGEVKRTEEQRAIIRGFNIAFVICAISLMLLIVASITKISWIITTFKIFTGTWVSIFIIGLVIVWIDENK